MYSFRRYFVALICVLLTFTACAQDRPLSTEPPPTDSQETVHADEALPAIAQVPLWDEPSTEIPKTLEQWVFTGYEQTISWRDPDNRYCAMELTLPALIPSAEFAVEFNRSVHELGQSLIMEAEECRQNGWPPSTVSVSYQVLTKDDVLLVVISRLYFDDSCSQTVYAFEPEDRQALRIGELAEELTGLDYPVFLQASAALIREAFIARYEAQIRQWEAVELPDENGAPTHPNAEIIAQYYEIVDTLPSAAMTLSGIQLLVDENGQTVLLCTVPSLGDTPCAPEPIPYTPELLPEGSIPSLPRSYVQLFDMQYYVDGAYADAYSGLLLEAFLAEPEDFIRYAGQENAASRETVTGFLLYALDEADITVFQAACHDALEEENLTDVQRAMLQALLKAVP